MLQDILKIINRDRYISRTMISKELNAPIEIINDGINQLLRMGYMIEEKTGENCATVCGNCPYAKSCNKEIVRTFKVSDKSKILLNK